MDLRKPTRFSSIQREKGHIFKDDKSLKIVLLPCEKGSTLRGKTYAPFGSKFSPFSVDFFLEEA